MPSIPQHSEHTHDFTNLLPLHDLLKTVVRLRIWLAGGICTGLFTMCVTGLGFLAIALDHLLGLSSSASSRFVYPPAPPGLCSSPWAIDP